MNWTTIVLVEVRLRAHATLILLLLLSSLLLLTMKVMVLVRTRVLIRIIRLSVQMAVSLYSSRTVRTPGGLAIASEHRREYLLEDVNDE